MKKSVFLLSMLFACTCVSAQNQITQIGEIESYSYDPGYYSCPIEFCFEDDVNFIIRVYDAESAKNDKMTFEIYNDELQKTKTLTIPRNNFYYKNLNITGDYDSYAYVYLTQTLFNDDDKYEWIEYIDNGTNYTGFKVMQEGDVELCAIDFGVEVRHMELYLYTINDKVYLVPVVAGDSEQTATYYFYLIDSGEDTGIKYVGKVNGMSVSPTILNRSTPVTVDFADGSDVSHNITVTNSNGQVVALQNVAAGQSSVTLDTSHWGNGLNIVTTKNANNETQSCKIIVK